jgi:leucyl-tRNA synthetase
MMAPITPHWSENIWGMLDPSTRDPTSTARSTSVCDALWPSYTPYDRALRKQYVFFREFMKNIRQSAIKLKIPSPKAVHVFIASMYEGKKVSMLKMLQSVCDEAGNFPADLMRQMKEFCEGDPALKKDTKLLMQFGAFMRDEAKDRGKDALAFEMTFDQKAILEENMAYIKRALELKEVSFYNVEEEGFPPACIDKKKADIAVPGKPSFSFFTTTD